MNGAIIGLRRTALSPPHKDLPHAACYPVFENHVFLYFTETLKKFFFSVELTTLFCHGYKQVFDLKIVLFLRILYMYTIKHCIYPPLLLYFP